MRGAAFTGVLALAVPAAAGGGIPWERDPGIAFVRAAETRAPVLVFFTSGECGGRAAAGDLARATSGGGPVAPTQDFVDRCSELEQDVLSQAPVVEAATRFVPVLAEEGLLPSARHDSQERNLNRRYQVATLPTVLFADPWGNEIIRLVGKVGKDRFLQVIRAIPADFAPVEKAALRLRADGEDAAALVAVAAFYESQGLLPVSERLYEKAMDTPALRADVAGRRQVVLARGMDLLRMQRAKDAAKLYAQVRKEDPEGPATDALLFGELIAELQDGHAKEARALLQDLEKRFPASPYTAKARERVAAAK